MATRVRRTGAVAAGHGANDHASYVDRNETSSKASATKFPGVAGGRFDCAGYAGRVPGWAIVFTQLYFRLFDGVLVSSITNNRQLCYRLAH